MKLPQKFLYILMYHMFLYFKLKLLKLYKRLSLKTKKSNSVSKQKSFITKILMLFLKMVFAIPNWNCYHWNCYHLNSSYRILLTWKTKKYVLDFIVNNFLFNKKFKKITQNVTSIRHHNLIILINSTFLIFRTNYKHQTIFSTIVFIFFY